MAIAAVVLLSVGLLPQVSYAATSDEGEQVAAPMEAPLEELESAEPVDEDLIDAEPVETDLVESDAEPEPVETKPVESDAKPDAESKRDAEAQTDAETKTDADASAPTDDEYLSPLDGDYAGDVTEDEANPGGEPVAQSRSQARSVSPDSFSIQTLAGFSAGNIINDARLYTSGTLSVAGIQTFLNGKLTSCVSGYTCLKDFTQTTVTRAANAYCSNSYTGARDETAAEIIAKVAKACNISEKVLLVMLQKEQGLITHRSPSRTRYDRAMGFGCPDTGPGGTANCDPSYAGFGYQMYMAAYQLQRYTKDSYFNWFPVGKTSWVRWHPNVSCGSAAVTIQNTATAALYYYTPYQPNRAALNAGYGTGDGCSSYGNRNFYNYYTDWFGSTGSANLCEIPSSVKTARLQYVTTASLNARKAPSTGCADGVFTVAAGSVFQAVRATADETWIELRTPQGPRWMSREFLRVASADQAACVLPGSTKAASGDYYVKTQSTMRIAPSTACGTDSGTLRAGSVVNISRQNPTGSWSEIRTHDGSRWVPTSVLTPATSAQISAVCVDPAGTTASAAKYLVTSNTAAWRSPLERCGAGGASVGEGAVVQASRVSASGLWVEVWTQGGPRWVAEADLAPAGATDIVAACQDPAGTRTTTVRFVLRADTRGWVSPLTSCGTDSRAIPSGTVLQATRVSSSGLWIQVSTGPGNRWVPRSVLATCADPAGTRASSAFFVLGRDAQSLVSPLAECGTAAANWELGAEPRPVKAGTVVQATRVSSSGQWVEIRTGAGNRWIPRSSLDTCAAPAGTRNASKAYVVRSRTSLYISPLADCGTAPVARGAGTAPVAVSAGTVLQAVKVSASGKWLQVRTQSGLRWVQRSALGYATSANLASSCAQPAGTKAASRQYRVNTSTVGWRSPVTKCGAGEAIAAGSVVQAVRVSASGQWLKVRTQSGERWIARGDVSYATAANVAAACAQPAGTRPASSRYVVTSTTIGWVSPLTKCGTASRSLAAGTVLQATRVSSSGDWLQVRVGSGHRWVARDDVRVA